MLLPKILVDPSRVLEIIRVITIVIIFIRSHLITFQNSDSSSKYILTGFYCG